MSAAAVTLRTANQKGIKLAVDGDKLTYEAPAGALTSDLRAALIDNKPVIIAALTADLSVEELQAEAGPDWSWLQRHVQALKAFADCVRISRMRQRGEVPAHYTATTNCRGCGPVPIFPGAAQVVDLCPWCWNRATGLPVPKR